MAGNNGAKNNSLEKCLVCNDVSLPANHLTGHLKKVHNISKMDYVIKYILNNKIPTCSCGCGELVKVYDYKPYIVRKFVKGHHARGEHNSMFGKSFSEEAKKKMVASAKKRVQKQKSKSPVLPMHTKDAIEKRALKWSAKFISKIEQENDITVKDYTRQPRLKYVLECNACNNVFEQYHQSYFRCFTCHPRIRSKYEEEIYEWLRQELPQSTVVQRNNRIILSTGQELDFYMPDLKVAIEFNGLYYHSEYLGGKLPNYHLEKTKLCQTLGIRLIHIFEDEWVFKNELVKQKILRIMGVNTSKSIFARKCTIKELSMKESSDFLNVYHIQGADKAKIRLGLVYNGEIVGVMTFSRPNASRGVNNTQSSFELSRYATSYEYSVVGGASKLLKHFIKNYGPETIVSYADLRWSDPNSNMYDKIGFSLTKVSPPSYWYFKINDLKRYHRFNFTKKATVKMGGLQTNTEWENMKLLGYDRIWDCGSLRYEMVIT